MEMAKIEQEKSLMNCGNNCLTFIERILTLSRANRVLKKHYDKAILGSLATDGFVLDALDAI